MEPLTFFVTYKPLVTIAHVLCVVIGMGGAILTDILFAFFAFNKKLGSTEASVIKRISHIVTWALTAVILTGLCLFLSDPATYLQSTKFLTKMTVVTALCINGFLLHRYIFSHLSDPRVLSSRNSHAWRTAASLLGAISFVSWVTALSLGVMDSIPLSYLEALLLYILAITLGLFVSQILLKLYESTRIRSHS
jgi:hypothetical protein